MIALLLVMLAMHPNNADALEGLTYGAAITQPWGQLNGQTRGIILGEPTCGKSFLVEKLTREAWRSVYFDVSGDDYTKPGRVVVTVDELETWPSLLDDPHLRMTIIPQGEDSAEIAGELRRVLSVLGMNRRPPPQRNLIFSADEIGDYRYDAEGALNNLFRRGRHLGIGVLLASQVATDIPRTCRRIPTHVWSFGQSDEADLKILEKRYGAEFAAKVAAWRKHGPKGGPYTYDPPVLWERSMVLTDSDSNSLEGA